MKTINETFTDEEHYLLVKKKEKQSWHDFILMLTKKGGKQKMKITFEYTDAEHKKAEDNLKDIINGSKE